MIKDRRHTNRLIPIHFITKETFENYPAPGIFTMTLVTDGSWEFSLNHIDYCLAAPFILCLNDTDIFELKNKKHDAAKTFVFNATFLNSSLTKEALNKDTFEKIEDMHDRNLIQAFFLRNENYKLRQSFDQIERIELIISDEENHILNLGEVVCIVDENDFPEIAQAICELTPQKHSSPTGSCGYLVIAVHYRNGDVEVIGSDSVGYISEQIEDDGWLYIPYKSLYDLFIQYVDPSIMPFEP